jgi:hypothetical protein
MVVGKKKEFVMIFKSAIREIRMCDDFYEFATI